MASGSVKEMGGRKYPGAIPPPGLIFPYGHPDCLECFQVAPRRPGAHAAFFRYGVDGQAVRALVEQVLHPAQPRQPVLLILPHGSHLYIAEKNYTTCAGRSTCAGQGDNNRLTRPPAE